MITISQKAKNLIQGNYLADLVSLMPDGSPHIAPVWYKYDGKNYLILTEPNTTKVRNINNDGRVAILVSTPSPPYAYVMVKGRGEISESNHSELLTELSIKYLGETEGKEYADKMLVSSEFVLITLVPNKIIEYFDSTIITQPNAIDN